MTTYKYKGLSPDGAKLSGVIKAYNEFEAVAQLRETCSVITKIEEVKETQSWNKQIGTKKIKDKELAIICSQFAIILTSGLPIVRCVEMVAAQARTKELQRMLKKVAEDVSGGEIVSMDAMADFIKEMAKENGISRGAAAVILPGTLVFTRNVTVPAMTDGQLLYNLPFEFKDYLTQEKN